MRKKYKLEIWIIVEKFFKIFCQKIFLWKTFETSDKFHCKPAFLRVIASVEHKIIQKC